MHKALGLTPVTKGTGGVEEAKETIALDKYYGFNKKNEIIEIQQTSFYI